IAVADQNGQSGDVQLFADVGPGVSGTAIPLVSGIGQANLNLSAAGTTRFYNFTTPANVTGNGTVSAVPTDTGLDTVVLVTDAAGTEIATARMNNPGSSDIANLAGLLPNTTYYITV